MNESISLITTFMFLLSAAIFGGAIAQRIKLPSIVGYIFGGILVATLVPSYLNHAFISSISEIGITLLLFAIGIEFSFHRLRSIFRVIVLPAVAQIVLCVTVFIAVLLFFQISFSASLYLASAMALSSTAVVVKLLSERGELDTLPAKLATGWLVVQDLAVIPMLILLSSLGVASASVELGAAISTVFFALLKATVFIVVLLYFGKVAVPKLIAAVASMHNRELFLLTTMGIVAFVGLATYTAGLSIALGAFLAGLLISETSQNHAVFAEIRPLRDLFAVIFFVSLGMNLPGSVFLQYWSIIASLTLFVLLIKGGLVYGLLRYLGYHRKNAFLTGMYLAQMSEFGFVLAKAGQLSGVLSDVHANILIAVTFLTIAVNAPLIGNANAVYNRVRLWLQKIPKHFPEKEEESLAEQQLPYENHVVVCGYGRIGKYIGRALQMCEIPFVVVDLNQATLKTLRDSGIETVFGDPAEYGVLDYAQVDRARALVVAIPDRHTQEMVIAHALSLNRRIKIICRTHQEEDQKHLKALGVQTVIQPEFEASLAIVNKLFTDFGISDADRTGKISRLKIEHGVG